MYRKKNISKWYLTRVGWFDVTRYPGALIASSFVVAGICLPLLLLIGLKRGLVEQFIDDINKSPTAREISLWVVQEKAVLTPTAIAELIQKNPSIEVVIPNIKKVVELRSGPRDDISIDGLTLLATDESDPYLAAHKVTAPKASERALVLSKHVADKLDANIGDTLQMEVSRSEGGATGHVHIDVTVKDIIETGSREESVGYAHWKMLELIEEYQTGEAIPEFGWPSFQMPTRAGYTCFLCFSQRLLTDMDILRLKADGLRADFLSESDPNDPRLNLYGLLRDDVPKYVYAIMANTVVDEDMPELSFTSAEIETKLETSVVAIPWNEPVMMDIGETMRLLVGLTIRPRWLKEQFVVHDGWFETSEPEFRVAMLEEEDSNEIPKTINMQLSADIKIPLIIQPVSFIREVNDVNQDVPDSGMSALPNSVQAAIGPVTDSNDHKTTVVDANQAGGIETAVNRTDVIEQDIRVNPQSQPRADVVVVPASLLAHIHQYQDGRTRFDEDSLRFVRLKSPIGYYQARIFARTLGDVPTLHNELRKQFAVESSLTRILEMQDYARTLWMLVNVVGCVVFAFGLVTVTSLLSDITGRKKGDIGILSCMGIPKWAAVYFVIIRATLIGVLGCLIAYVLSVVISMALDRYGVQCVAPVYDLWWLLPFSVVCCWAGSVLPAWHAARMDPIKALNLGRV